MRNHLRVNGLCEEENASFFSVSPLDILDSCRRTFKVSGPLPTPRWKSDGRSVNTKHKIELPSKLPVWWEPDLFFVLSLYNSPVAFFLFLSRVSL